MVSRSLTSAAVALALVLSLPAALHRGGGPRPVAATASPHTGHAATCARQSGAEFPGAFASRENLVAGPLAMVGARRPTSAGTVEAYGGNKFPVLVRPRHTVTVRISGAAAGAASLFYAPTGDAPSGRRVRDGYRAVTFRPCGPRRAISQVDGDPVTFWSGFVLVSRPMCVPLEISIDDRARPLRRHIVLGSGCR